MRTNFAFFLAFLYLSYSGTVHGCEVTRKLSGVISATSDAVVSACWQIKVPEDRYATLKLVQKSFHESLSCDAAFVKIQVALTNQTVHYCSRDSSVQPVTALTDVTIEAVLKTAIVRYYYFSSSFEISYKIESIMCTRKNNFRCSEHTCIRKDQVCNGVKDCENGIDENGCETGINTVKGVKNALHSAIAWLKGERAASYGWGKETHRAITALYLAGATDFHGNSLEDELMAKQLELQTSVSLLRNSTDPLSASDMSMFINALSVTCHNPRHFYGHDLLQILHEMIATSKSPVPGAYLTLCNSNWTLSEKHVRDMLRVLTEPSEYGFILDLQAMAMMALTCIRNKMENFQNIANASQTFNETIEKFIRDQLSDGSFGNIYTTALVTQVLIANEQENNELWDLKATMQYLIHKINSPKDFISVYFTLPILNSKSLVDISEVKCSNPRKKREDAEIADIKNKLGGKLRIKYSLYIGDKKDVVHTITLRVPESSTVYDFMRLAEVADHKYKFLHRKTAGNMYIYEIAGIPNDPEAGKFWLLYMQKDHHTDGAMYPQTESPDKIILEDEEHLIMWYKTAHI